MPGLETNSVGKLAGPSLCRWHQLLWRLWYIADRKAADLYL